MGLLAAPLREGITAYDRGRRGNGHRGRRGHRAAATDGEETAPPTMFWVEALGAGRLAQEFWGVRSTCTRGYWSPNKPRRRRSPKLCRQGPAAGGTSGLRRVKNARKNVRGHQLSTPARSLDCSSMLTLRLGVSETPLTAIFIPVHARQHPQQ